MTGGRTLLSYYYCIHAHFGPRITFIYHYKSYAARHFLARISLFRGFFFQTSTYHFLSSEFYKWILSVLAATVTQSILAQTHYDQLLFLSYYVLHYYTLWTKSWVTCCILEMLKLLQKFISKANNFLLYFPWWIMSLSTCSVAPWRKCHVFLIL